MSRRNLVEIHFFKKIPSVCPPNYRLLHIIVSTIHVDNHSFYSSDRILLAQLFTLILSICTIHTRYYYTVQYCTGLFLLKCDHSIVVVKTELYFFSTNFYVLVRDTKQTYLGFVIMLS